VLQERIIRLKPRTVFGVLAAVIAVALAIEIVTVARQVLTWIVIALFLALALNPLVEFFQRHGIRRRVLATGTAFVLVIAAIAGFGATFVPVLVSEIDDFAAAVPGYLESLTEGRGRLGFLQSEYQIVDRVREAVEEGGVGRVVGASAAAVAVTKGVVTAVIAVITIAVLAFFMLLEGRGWIERVLDLLPPEREERWRRVGRDVYRTVGGYVTGALTIALTAGIVTAILLSILGVPYAIALGVVVALLDLIPLAGATLATIVVSTVAFLDSVPVGITVLVFFIIYQQVENHFLYPLVYSRTVQLSPLAILIAVLIGASLAGILGALGAIPVAGMIQVLLRDWLAHRRPRIVEAAGPPPATPEPG
jgi:predicted PurR-regulated permease PerM